MAEHWYTVHLVGSGGKTHTIDTLAASALEAEVDLIKHTDLYWPDGSPWRCTKSQRTRP